MTDQDTVPERRQAFLAALSRGLSVSRAAADAGIAASTLYSWRKSDNKFAEDWLIAVEAGTDRIEDEALRRAVDGTPKPIYRGGEKVDEIMEYSDSMLAFLLKARRPEKFKDKISDTAPELDLKGAKDALNAKFLKVAKPAKKKRVSRKPD